MKKKCFIVLVSFLIAFLFCSNSLFAKPQVIKLAHNVTSDPYTAESHAVAIVLKNYIEVNTGGKYEVKIYPNNVLGKERERFELLQKNIIQMNIGSLGGLSTIYSPIILLNTPFIYANDEIVEKVLHSDFVNKKLADDFFKKTGLKLFLVYQMGGLSCFTNSKKPVKKLEDMKGIKFRAMDASQVAMFESLGTKGVPIPWAEIYTALQTKVADGQVNPISVILNAKLYEVQKYITISHTILGANALTYNNDWFNSLPKDVQDIVRQGVKYADKTATGMTQLTQAIGVKQLKEEGMEVSVLSHEEYLKFKKLAVPGVLKWCKTKMDPKWVDMFLETVNKAEAQ